jgi:DNA anti-recombination protein RmuC
LRRVKGDFPGQDKELKKAGEEGYEAVRSTAQQYVRLVKYNTLRNCWPHQANQARTEAQKAEQKLDQYSVEARKKYEEAKREAEKEFNSTRKEVNHAVDKFDKNVIEGTRETKSWFGSWFK